jgi:ribosomal protein S18 acetylase RimI-like enzyme
VVEDGANGLLVPVKAPEPLAAAMESLLQDGERRRVMGAAGRALAAERFDARKVARTVLNTYQKVADQKGIPLLVEPGLAEKALPRDAGAIASLHGDSITSGFLASLGPGVLTQIYRGLIADPAGLVLVVRNPAGDPVGFVAGSADTAAFYRRTLRRRSLPLGLAALPALAAQPARLRRMVETLRYPSSVSTGLPAAELLAMAVSEQARSRGLGAMLVGEFLARLGAPAVRVVVGDDNEGARRFYRRQGFIPVEERELHSGQRSEVLVWRSL